MYIYIYSYILICIHILIHICICTYTYICTHTYIYTHIYTRYTHVITSTKFRLKQTWRPTKAIAEMKCDTEQTMKLE